MKRLPSASSRRDAIRSSVVALAAALAVVAATATPARASTTTATQPPTLTGTKDLSASGITATGAGVTATFDLVETVNWTQAGSLDVTYDPNLVRQGRSLDPSDSFSTSGAGSMSISWTLQNLHVSWDGIGPLDQGNPTFTATGPCTMKTTGSNVSCHLAGSQITLLDSCVVFPLPCAGPYVKLGLVDDVTISPDAVASHRQATFGGNADGENDLSLTDSPSTDPFSIPCTVGAGDSLTYSLGSVSSSQSISALTSLQFDVGAIASPGFPVPPVSVGFASPTVPLDASSGTIDMTGDDADFDLGAVQKNNVPPAVSAGGPYSGDEGSPVTFDGSGSSSICGFPTLRWDFSDGGVAFGKNPQHTFNDDGVYSGLLTATDATGLSSTTTFSVPIANLPPSVSAGPSKSTLWGVPVSFHANGSDPGPTDRLNLLYGWDFGDPNSPVGAVGQDATHIYSQPGIVTATVTVTDDNGATANAAVQVTVLKRGTATGYVGDLSAKQNKQVTVSASVVDELGQPVVGRTVQFTLGAQSATAATNSSGIATTAIKLNQKKGSYSVSASFAGDGKYTSSANAQTFTIG
jgi:PKD repeat protein